MEKDELNIIYPILVIYKIRLEDSKSYQSLLQANGVKHFLVYDNSPANYPQDTSKIPVEAQYIRNTHNGGVSVAYNTGANIAKELGYQRVLLLAKDTYFPADCWNQYLKHATYPGITAPQIRTKADEPFSPVSISGLRPKGLKNPMANQEYRLTQYAVVNSGICIPTDLFLAIKGYNPKVRLDFADFDFQSRLKAQSNHFFLIDCTAIQDFSNDCKEVKQLQKRFALYLESARYVYRPTWRNKISHHLTILSHTISLTLRTKSTSFVRSYLKHFLFL